MVTILNTTSTTTIWGHSTSQEANAFLLARAGYFAAQQIVADDTGPLSAAQIPNDKLLAIGQKFRPPQTWYDADEENLF